jgi:hypothetical protein
MNNDLNNLNKDDMENSIKISDSFSIAYWCAKLGCDKDALTKAVISIGNSPEKVKQFIELNRW